MDIKVSVKDIVESVFGSGDLISEGNLLKRAEEGTMIHQQHQAKYRPSDQAEVYVDYEEITARYNLNIGGRIDGVLKRESKIIIEEIKSTTKAMDTLDENTTPAHLAQAKFYAYLYLLKHNKRKINVRLTYIHVDFLKDELDGLIKELDFTYTLKELRNFFQETITEYINWLEIVNQHTEKRNKSIKGLTFPFETYRKGQRDLMAACYKTILAKDILYAIAPTGVGKTIATIFSALKAINEKEQKIFYLTAKNSGKRIALKTVSLLNERGLIIKAIEITAKDHICLLEERDCDPERCPYSKGYYNRIYKAIQDIFESKDIFTKETIIMYAEKHQVCPFEFSLDLSYYADLIICDYNYAFCPRTHLIRYFDDNTKYQPILLCDEAHNLVSRSKEMYSARISKINILHLAKLLKLNNKSFSREISYLMKSYDQFSEKLEKVPYQVIDFNDEFLGFVNHLLKKVDDFISDKIKLVYKNEIIKLLLDLLKFSKIAEYYDEDDFIFSIERVNDDIVVSISCLDASKFILKTIKERTVGTIMFSATLYPINYYQMMLTQNEGNYQRINSPFNQHHLKLITLASVSTRYKDRPESVQKIVDAIRILAGSKKGNYIVFFPSYQYLQMVLKEINNTTFDFEIIVQKRDFTNLEREEVIQLFKNNETTQVGLFVMGGVFSEGIDYIGDMLSGVIIVGTGLPMVGGYNNIIKAHFDERLGSGFDFAYTYPGFSKVVQAVGRVIRDESDRGIAVLIDDRFATYKYQKLYPREWSHMKYLSNSYDLSAEINDFWNSYKEESR